jgi:predicted RNase H-like HicB family nuclease
MVRNNPMKLRAILEPGEEGGYTVIVPALPGCISEGDTREEALQNIREAIALYLEPIDDDGVFSDAAEQVEIAV